MTAFRNLILTTLLGLGACGTPAANTAVDDVDPAIAAALSDPIMTDPQLEARADTDALRPAVQPFQALIPSGEPDPLRGDALPTLGGRADRTIARHDPKSFAACNRTLSYSIGWSNRLPDGIGLPTEARVSEAAGSDSPNCALRLVAFAAAPAPSTLIETYRRTAKSAGFTATETREGDVTVIKARRSNDGAVFLVSIGDAAAGGSSVDLMTNRGR